VVGESSQPFSDTHSLTPRPLTYHSLTTHHSLNHHSHNHSSLNHSLWHTHHSLFTHSLLTHSLFTHSSQSLFLRHRSTHKKTYSSTVLTNMTNILTLLRERVGYSTQNEWQNANGKMTKRYCCLWHSYLSHCRPNETNEAHERTNERTK